jgi:hypothetical protein
MPAGGVYLYSTNRSFTITSSSRLTLLAYVAVCSFCIIGNLDSLFRGTLFVKARIVTVYESTADIKNSVHLNDFVRVRARDL